MSPQIALPFRRWFSQWPQGSSPNAPKHNYKHHLRFRTTHMICRSALLALVAVIMFSAPLSALAQGIVRDDSPFVPSYRDPTLRSESPDLLGRKAVRFGTSDGFAPFQSTDAIGELSGFNIDLARALCDVLKISCTIQTLSWDDLAKALVDGRIDAVIAGLRPTPESRNLMDFTKRYIQLPARFVALADRQKLDTSPEGLKGQSIGVVAHSAHEAFLRAFFGDAVIRTFPDEAAARMALMTGEAAVLFGDGTALAAWLATAEGGCCAFRGGPYINSRYFGEGFAIGVRRGDDRLRGGLDHALDVVAGNGTFGNIYLKFFPIGVY